MKVVRDARRGLGWAFASQLESSLSQKDSRDPGWVMLLDLIPGLGARAGADAHRCFPQQE